MFCMQCEQTMNTPVAKGCVFAQGMCGKTAEVSDLQDVLIKYLQGISFWAKLGNEYGYSDAALNRWCTQAFFSTLTNVNFDPIRIHEFINEARSYKTAIEEKVQGLVTQNNASLLVLSKAAALDIPTVPEAVIEFAPMIAPKDKHVDDVVSAYLLCLYGLKGVAAYLEHAAVLEQTDPAAYQKYHEIMSYLGDAPDDYQELLGTALKIGELNYQVMGMLDKGGTMRFGDPEPSSVNIAATQGKCILVSGHDFEDLYQILVQTQDKGINVYTHGEMLPAHSYPKLKTFKHLVGNYGTAWQNQQKEFADFPGAIVMTSNCIINPDVGNYKDRIFTRSIVGWPGAKHINGNDFSNVIECALAQEGFKETAPEHLITIGFGRAALFNAAPAVIGEIKAGNIKHVFLVGGCDGDRQERSYYTEFAQKTPADTLMLTLACGKYRFNQQDYGNINGIPRLLDIGQCNDAYSAIQLALALADEFKCGVNDLPLTLVVSWFEQKAIAILLTLLALGVKGIYLGPTAPVFITPNLLTFLVEAFEIKLISTPDEDIKAMLG